MENGDSRWRSSGSDSTDTRSRNTQQRIQHIQTRASTPCTSVGVSAPCSSQVRAQLQRIVCAQISFPPNSGSLSHMSSPSSPRTYPPPPPPPPPLRSVTADVRLAARSSPPVLSSLSSPSSSAGLQTHFYALTGNHRHRGRGHLGTGSSLLGLQLLRGRCKHEPSLCGEDFNTRQALQCIDQGRAGGGVVGWGVEQHTVMFRSF